MHMLISWVPIHSGKYAGANLCSKHVLLVLNGTPSPEIIQYVATGKSTVSHLDISLHFDVDSPDRFDANAIPVVYVLPVHRYYIRPFGAESCMTRDKMGVFCGLMLEPTSNAWEYRRYGYFETSSPDFVEEICLGCEQLFVGVENRGSKDETSHHRPHRPIFSSTTESSQRSEDG